MKTTKVYAIDQSLTGTAHTILEDGHPVFGERIDTSKITGFDRVRVVAKRVDEVIAAHAPDVVVMENYAFGANTNNITKLAELGGVLKWHFFGHGYGTGRDAVLRGEKVFFTQTQGRMKKFCLGNGAKKKDSGYLLAVFDRLQKRFATDDEADAYMHAWTASIVVGVVRGVVPLDHLNACQQEALIEGAVKSRKGLSISKALKLPEEEKQKLVRDIELEC